MTFRGVAGKIVGWNLVAMSCAPLSTQIGAQAAPKTQALSKTPTTNSLNTKSFTTKTFTTKEFTTKSFTASSPFQKRDKKNEALLHLETALDLLSLGDKSGAKKQADEAHRLAGDSPEVSTLLAYVREREGRAAQAQSFAPNAAKNIEPDVLYMGQLSQNLSSHPLNMADKVPGFADENGQDTFRDGIPTRLAQKQHHLAILEAAMVVLVNRERRTHGLNDLQLDATLADTARAHSADMRDRKYFAHEAPTASLRAPLDRYMAVFSVEPRMVAENLYNVWGGRRNPSQADIVEAQRKLMESPGHRANILLHGVTHIGIGIVSNANGDLWLTQMFSQPGR